jgi:hypothetical protein
MALAGGFWLFQLKTYWVILIFFAALPVALLVIALLYAAFRSWIDG